MVLNELICVCVCVCSLSLCSIHILCLNYIDDDTVSAESYIKKASFLADSCKAEDIRLQFKVCYARILDSKRKFLEAAMRYYEISQITTSTVNVTMPATSDVKTGGSKSEAKKIGNLKIDIEDVKVNPIKIDSVLFFLCHL